MIFTLYYMYATILQWWRLGSLRNKINGTLNTKNALLLTTSKSIHNTKRQRSLENLLYHVEDRIACTVIPKHNLNLSHWLSFPKDFRCFPIHIEPQQPFLKPPFFHIVVRTTIDNYIKHQAEIIQIEKFGELIAWKATSKFQIILKSDIENLTKLVHCFSNSPVDINHELEILEIETVNIEGSSSRIRYEKKYSLDQTLKYSYAPIHWNKFTAELKELYLKIRDSTNPKIKIENGSKTEDSTKKPIYEVKPIKKHSEDKNTLEVEHRRHKTESSKKTHKHKIEKKNKKSETVKKVTLVEDPKEPKDEKKAKRSTSKDKKTPINVKEVQNETVTSKPPNILVYADSVITKENVKKVLNSIINNERYVIYDLPVNATNNLWSDTTALVIICGNVSPDLTQQLLSYLVNGGQLLCLCSDLLHCVLNTFTTAEVREHELVRFSYGEWRRVKMMHHIFCYQASPAKKQFSKDSVESNHSNGSSPKACRTPSVTEIQHNGKNYILQVQVLGAEETWQTPSLLLASVKNSTGKAVFSQVHLEIDPLQYEDDESKFAALKESNNARLQIMRDILSTRLEIDCNRPYEDILYSPGYFLGRHDMKMEMLQECKDIVNNILKCEKLTVEFCGHKTDPGEASATRLPVLILSCPKNFSTVDYFSTLNTDVIGRLVVYTDIITSTQHLLNKVLRHGLVVIGRQQSNGIGRSKNTWLSPPGSACFSLQLHIPLSSPLGRALSLIQQVVPTAIVSAIKKDYQDLDIGIKWPNDIYANGTQKIGGLIVNSTIGSKMAIVNIGVGVNLDNTDPTTSLNRLIADLKDSSKLNYESFFAKIFNEFEHIYDIVQNDHLDYFFDLYYKYWMHGNANVKIQTENLVENAKIIGIDDFGFLKVLLENGKETVVHPDGNSFDMTKGLIAPKVF